MILEQEILIFNQYFSLKRATQEKLINQQRNKILFTFFLSPRYNKHRPQQSIQ